MAVDVLEVGTPEDGKEESWMTVAPVKVMLVARARVVAERATAMSLEMVVAERATAMAVEMVVAEGATATAVEMAVSE